ncbi:tetratricopeptide repeat protein [Streptomyces sp. NPDC012510]|uniref:tetratricopeptide repeat protein n=1 Tax=Streptomyces sp. NPDC012510 TaxID=3364838 RepID=UPI0036E75DE6
MSAVTGMGGIGKTALAVEAAHRAGAEGWFPGGFLFIDLRGYDDNPATADQGVLALLDAMGVRGTDLPPTTARQYDEYQRLLSARQDRMLLILDNASAASPYLSLVPGTAHHSVLITSRDYPNVNSVRVIELGTLDRETSVALITHALHTTDERDDRPSREPEALREIASLCGGLPLALQIAAGMLHRRRYRDIAWSVAQIREAEDPTAALDRGSPVRDLNDRSLVLRPVLETSYRRLPPDQARLLRLLSLAPGSETTTEAVTALLDLDTPAALDLLEGLVTAYLVAPVRDGGGRASDRWRLHDLVRAFGLSVVAEDEALREEGEAARERILEFYYRWANAADSRLRWLPGMAEPERFTTRAQALAWLDGERAGLVATVLWAGEERFADAAVLLALCLGEYLALRRFFDDRIGVYEAAQKAAQRSGDRHCEAVAWNNLGLALREAGHGKKAIDAHTRALALYTHGKAKAWNNLGIALREEGRGEEAIDAHARARELYAAAGDLHGETAAWNNLGIALRGAGRTGEAITALVRARDLCRAGEDRLGEAYAWTNLGNALLEADRGEEAIEAHGKALAIFREAVSWYETGLTLENLGEAHRRTGRPAEARAHWLEAVRAYTRADALDLADEARTHAANVVL